MTFEFTKQITEAISPLLTCETTEELIRTFDDFTKQNGLHVASFQLIRPIGWDEADGPVIAFSKGFPESARESYVKEKQFRHDPLFKIATRTGQAFWWSDIEKMTELTPEQALFMKDFYASGFGEGFSMPTYGPGGLNGYFGLGKGVDERFGPDNVPQYFQLYCQTVHLRYCKLVRKRRRTVNLSIKEREVMTHVVHGLSTNQIADVLGVSPNTINTHLKRVYVKMGVQDRVSATLRFLAFGHNLE